MLSYPLALALLVITLLGPLGSGADGAGPARSAAGTAQNSGDSPAVLGLPPKIHVLSSRGVDGPGAPSTPVVASTGSTRVEYPGAAGVATTPGPAAPDEPPGNSWWGRAPPRTSV
jgi:hypothetical protein